MPNIVFLETDAGEGTQFDEDRDLTTKDKRSFKANLTTRLGHTVFVYSEQRGAMKEEVQALHKEGLGVREIGRKLGINSGSVSRFLQNPTKNKPTDF